MPNTGLDLINAIVGNNILMSLADCPAVPVQMGKAVYGSVQDDSGPGEKIEPGSNMQSQIDKAIHFTGTVSETAVWHFLMGPTVHHFVVIPWYVHAPTPGRVYTVFMAYENQYWVEKYVKGIPPAPNLGGTGYKTEWTAGQLSTMFSDLLTNAQAWQNYFGQVVAPQAQQITYWKYKVIGLEPAIANVKRYTG